MRRAVLLLVLACVALCSLLHSDTQRIFKAIDTNSDRNATAAEIADYFYNIYADEPEDLQNMYNADYFDESLAHLQKNILKRSTLQSKTDFSMSYEEYEFAMSKQIQLHNVRNYKTLTTIVKKFKLSRTSTSGSRSQQQ
jgi:hypothetical protein